MSAPAPTVRVAIVGCGAISEAHLRAIRAATSPRIEVAGLFDQNQERAQQRASQHGVERVYRSWQELLDDSSADVVDVLLPHDAHAQFAIQALEAGHHVVCEKPLATSIEECDQMIAAARKVGKRLHPVHNRVYDPATDAARQFLQDGNIGRVFLAQTLGLEPPQTVSVRPWLGTKAGGGGVLLAQAIHPAYVLRWVLGDFAEVACFSGDQKVVDMTAEDTAVALLRFTSGALAEMTGTFGMQAGPHEHNITFYGPQGYVEMSSRRGTLGISERAFGTREARPLLEHHEWGTGFRRMWEDYAQGFATGSATRVTAEDGKRAVEIILAAYRAAAERRTVTLPL